MLCVSSFLSQINPMPCVGLHDRKKEVKMIISKETSFKSKEIRHCVMNYFIVTKIKE